MTMFIVMHFLKMVVHCTILVLVCIQWTGEENPKEGLNPSWRQLDCGNIHIPSRGLQDVSGVLLFIYQTLRAEATYLHNMRR